MLTWNAFKSGSHLRSWQPGTPLLNKAHSLHYHFRGERMKGKLGWTVCPLPSKYGAHSLWSEVWSGPNWVSFKKRERENSEQVRGQDIERLFHRELETWGKRPQVTPQEMCQVKPESNSPCSTKRTLPEASLKHVTGKCILCGRALWEDFHHLNLCRAYTNLWAEDRGFHSKSCRREVETWLGSEGHLLLFQRSWVQFLAPR